MKSLNPFYTEEKVISDAKLEGRWKSKGGFWEITPFKEMWEEHKKNEKTTKEDIELYKRFKNSYFLKYNQNAKKSASFVVTAFKVDDNTFLDFFPVDYETDGLDNLVSQHLLKTHSVCYAVFNDNESFDLKWLDEDVIGRLIKNHNLKINYETIGYNDDFVLTAKSEELYRFLQKFMTSDIENKWEDDQIYTLTPLNE